MAANLVLNSDSTPDNPPDNPPIPDTADPPPPCKPNDPNCVDDEDQPYEKQQQQKDANAINFGKRAEGAQARLDALTRNPQSEIARMRSAGLTESGLRNQLALYQRAVANGTGEGVASIRVEIVRMIMRYW